MSDTDEKTVTITFPESPAAEVKPQAVAEVQQPMGYDSPTLHYPRDQLTKAMPHVVTPEQELLILTARGIRCLYSDFAYRIDKQVEELEARFAKREKLTDHEEFVIRLHRQQREEMHLLIRHTSALIDRLDPPPGYGMPKRPLPGASANMPVYKSRQVRIPLDPITLQPANNPFAHATIADFNLSFDEKPKDSEDKK